MNDPEDVQRLIRLKRFETPGEDYYEGFLESFKERQRSELLRGSARGLLLERFGMWLEQCGGARCFVPAGAIAATAIGLGLYFAGPQREEPASSNVTAANAGDQSLETAAADTITLTLPKPSLRVPGIPGVSSLGGSQVLPAGARPRFREL
jgi:hypothetical protein